MKAFCCKTCGHLVEASHAGDQPVPHACPVCGAGVTWSSKGQKTFQPENWEVLAEATSVRLQELGLQHHEIEKHTPKAEKKISDEYVIRHASDAPGVLDQLL